MSAYQELLYMQLRPVSAILSSSTSFNKPICDTLDFHDFELSVEFALKSPTAAFGTV